MLKGYNFGIKPGIEEGLKFESKEEVFQITSTISSFSYICSDKMVDFSVSEDRKTFQFSIQVYLQIKRKIVGLYFCFVLGLCGVWYCGGRGGVDAFA